MGCTVSHAAGELFRLPDLLRGDVRSGSLRVEAREIARQDAGSGAGIEHAPAQDAEPAADDPLIKFLGIDIPVFA